MEYRVHHYAISGSLWERVCTKWRSVYIFGHAKARSVTIARDHWNYSKRFGKFLWINAVSVGSVGRIISKLVSIALKYSHCVSLCYTVYKYIHDLDLYCMYTSLFSVLSDTHNIPYNLSVNCSVFPIISKPKHKLVSKCSKESLVSLTWVIDRGILAGIKFWIKYNCVNR